MKIRSILLAFFMLTTNSYAEDLISREDARNILNMPQKKWNAQVMIAANSGFSIYQETYGGTLKQIVKGPDWELSTYPIYGGVKSAPGTLEVKISYKKNNPAHSLTLKESEDICAKAFNQLRVEFSFLCGYAKAEEELRFTFLISKPGNREDIDAFNAKGVYSFDQQRVEDTASAAAKKLIPMYWAQLDKWAKNKAASKEQLIEMAAKDLPMICSKLVTSYALAAGKTPSTSQKDREEWDFNTDFCVKATVHIRFPQPEFENPKILDMVCHRQKAYEFNYNLCKRAGVFR